MFKKKCKCNLRDNTEYRLWIVITQKEDGAMDPVPGKTVFLDIEDARKYAKESGKVIQEAVFKQVDIDTRIVE